MASPDTEELATVPQPTPAPDTKKALQPVAEDPATAETAPHRAIDPAVSAAEVAPHRAVDPAVSAAEVAPHRAVDPARSAAEVAPHRAVDPARSAAEVAPHRVIDPVGSATEAAAHRAVDPAAAVAETAPHQAINPADGEIAPQEALTGPAEAVPSAAGADEPAAATGADGGSSPETVEQGVGKPAKQRGRWWRGFTGSLAAGLTVLAVGVLVVAGVCLYTDAPGPGPVLLIGHPVAAVLALLAQRVADRRNGLPAAGAGIAVVLFVVSALTLFWLT
ncbi:hypothetical protein ACGFMK_15995 [Amycolatopsis sp. NPDC049252]|uniref:hypothetical protein n=1 Tax=Amycolatopsis sp. NPDC049252 TaxID=3363933 RepID=UPI003724B8CF